MNTKIVLGLDVPKTVAQINTDVRKLQKQLQKVETTGTLDTGSTVKQINAQIASLHSQLKTNPLFAQIRQAASELKEIDTLLYEIGKSNASLSSSDLARIGDGSFDAAGRYGRKAADYLSELRDASRAGFENASGIAELSIAAQEAGDMTAGLASQYIVAADKSSYRKPELRNYVRPCGRHVRCRFTGCFFRRSGRRNYRCPRDHDRHDTAGRH